MNLDSPITFVLTFILNLLKTVQRTPHKCKKICVIFCFKLRDQVEIISGNTHHYITNAVESIELNVNLLLTVSQGLSLSPPLFVSLKRAWDQRKCGC